METPKSLTPVPFILAIENDAHRKRLAASFTDVGLQPQVVVDPNIIHRLTREQYASCWICLDTDDDIAWLVQLVNDYHRSPFYFGGTAPIICIASERAVEANRRLGAWLIGGSAPVEFVWYRETDCRPWLRNFVERITHPVQDVIPERPTYDDLVTRVLNAPTEGRRLLELGIRLNEWQDSHSTCAEVARAFMRHAVMLMPDSAEAQMHYGRSFPWGRHTEGLPHLQEAVRLAPHWAEAYLALGHYYAHVDKPEALRALRRAIALDPDGDIGKKANNVIQTTGLADQQA